MTVPVARHGRSFDRIEPPALSRHAAVAKLLVGLERPRVDAGDGDPRSVVTQSPESVGLERVDGPAPESLAERRIGFRRKLDRS